MAGELSVRHVTKFGGKNFSAWKFQLNVVLIAYDLLDVVNGTTAKPEDLTTEDGKKWVKANAKATYVISSSVHALYLS